MSDGKWCRAIDTHLLRNFAKYQDETPSLKKCPRDLGAIGVDTGEQRMRTCERRSDCTLGWT